MAFALSHVGASGLGHENLGRSRVRRTFLILTAIVAAGIAQAAHELEDRDLENGIALYAEHCASCHGANLEGQPDWQSADENGILPAPPHNERGHTWHHDNGLLFLYTKLGGKEALAERGIADFNSGMPGFGETLTDDEIWNVLAFIRSTWPERVQEIQAVRNRPHN
ncbi:MAG: cytochrome c [Silicimonas sp.]|nr:cytochrome c [Silicimonas sp.]